MNIWLVPLEKIETRYTYEWYDHIPNMFATYCKNNLMPFRYVEYESRYIVRDTVDVLMINVSGEMPEQTASTGAFINFASTNVWKSSQGQKIAQAFYEGSVKAGDKFYFTDAWNPTIIQVRYMSDLLGIPVHIVGQWHAGWHDPNDFLGRNIVHPEWAATFEASLFHAIDTNLFTTDAYIELFFDRLSDFIGYSKVSRYSKNKILRTGYPNSYLRETLRKYKDVQKERIVLFPHRIAPEKQLDIFKDLARLSGAIPDMKDVKWLVCQEQHLTKPEYHDMLGRSQIVFSAALQETYGIAQTEAVFVNAFPLSPDRLSYSEMYKPEFLYPSEWTDSFDDYAINRNALMNKIREMMNTPVMYQEALPAQEQYLVENYIGDEQICKHLTHKG